jgi:hypothetical protein
MITFIDRLLEKIECRDGAESEAPPGRPQSRGNQMPEERKRAALMAAWTQRHGKDDANNPYSKGNYVVPDTDLPAAERAALAAPASRQPDDSTARRGSDATPPHSQQHSVRIQQHASWLDQLPEGGVREVFAHLAAHGTVTEDEAARMLGGRRGLRRFALEFDLCWRTQRILKVQKSDISTDRRAILHDIPGYRTRADAEGRCVSSIHVSDDSGFNDRMELEAPPRQQTQKHWRLEIEHQR